MEAERQIMTSEPKVSMRGGGVIGDWYVDLRSPGT
jgi:hypothetical protein